MKDERRGDFAEYSICPGCRRVHHDGDGSSQFLIAFERHVCRYCGRKRGKESLDDMILRPVFTSSGIKWQRPDGKYYEEGQEEKQKEGEAMKDEKKGKRMFRVTNYFMAPEACCGTGPKGEAVNDTYIGAIAALGSVKYDNITTISELANHWQELLDKDIKYRVEEFYEPLPEPEIDWIEKLKECAEQEEWGNACACVLCLTINNSCNECPLAQFAKAKLNNPYATCDEIALHYRNTMWGSPRSRWHKAVMLPLLADCIRWYRKRRQ